MPKTPTGIRRRSRPIRPTVAMGSRLHEHADLLHLAFLRDLQHRRGSLHRNAEAVEGAHKTRRSAPCVLERVRLARRRGMIRNWLILPASLPRKRKLILWLAITILLSG